MKMGFSKSEVAAMTHRLLMDGWLATALGRIEELNFHTPQADWLVTVESKNGIQIKLPKSLLPELLQSAFLAEHAPIKVDNPMVAGVKCHNSMDQFVSVDVRDAEIESKYGSEPETDIHGEEHDEEEETDEEEEQEPDGESDSDDADDGNSFRY